MVGDLLLGVSMALNQCILKKIRTQADYQWCLQLSKAFRTFFETHSLGEGIYHVYYCFAIILIIMIAKSFLVYYFYGVDLRMGQDLGTPTNVRHSRFPIDHHFKLSQLI